MVTKKYMVLHCKPPSDYFVLKQFAVVSCRLHGRCWFVCNYLATIFQRKSCTFWNMLVSAVRHNSHCLHHNFSSFTTNQWLINEYLQTSQHLSCKQGWPGQFASNKSNQKHPLCDQVWATSSNQLPNGLQWQEVARQSLGLCDRGTRENTNIWHNWIEH